MRATPKWILLRSQVIAVALALLVVGCATVAVSPAGSPQAQTGPVPAQGAWKFDAGNRPPADRDGYRPPVKLAVLLPLSGSLAGAAAPVRDGFLTGYYGETRRRPEIAFYDTAGTPAGAVAAYARAASEGNDFVVGPLGRDEVGAVFADAQAGVPMLALNRASGPPPAGNASFSLSPEDDGIAAAQYMLSRNAKRVLVL